jgi:hypothetical protein
MIFFCIIHGVQLTKRESSLYAERAENFLLKLLTKNVISSQKVDRWCRQSNFFRTVDCSSSRKWFVVQHVFREVRPLEDVILCDEFVEFEDWSSSKPE